MPKICCRALTAECLSCMEGITPQEFCKRPENSHICEGDITIHKIYPIHQKTKNN